MQRARVVVQHERPGPAEHDQVAARGVLADDVLGGAPVGLLVDRVGRRLGAERQADRREPQRHRESSPPIDSSRGDGLGSGIASRSATSVGIARSRNGTPRRSASCGPTSAPPAP